MVDSSSEDSSSEEERVKKKNKKNDTSSEESVRDKKKKKDKKSKRKQDKKHKSDKKTKKDKKGKKLKKQKKDKKTKKDKDPFSENARERARLEAQQRGMGIVQQKKKKRKRKSSSSSSSSSSANSEGDLQRMRLQVEGASDRKLKESLAGDSKPSAPPEKPVSEMTWPERAASAACKAEADAIWDGATPAEAQKAAEEAGEAVMRRALQFGYVETAKRAKFDATKGAQKKLSPVEQARAAGQHPVAFSGGGGPTFRGGGRFGMTAPKMTGGLEGGGYMG